MRRQRELQAGPPYQAYGAYRLGTGDVLAAQAHVGHREEQFRIRLLARGGLPPIEPIFAFGALSG
jgi:hypothetical protein